tara:strand:- start:3582 stop:3767 length:186 start_codon:yes stop_codon:yes gene_type:complete
MSALFAAFKLKSRSKENARQQPHQRSPKERSCPEKENAGAVSGNNKIQLLAQQVIYCTMQF